MSLAYLGIFVSALIGSGVAALADLLQKDTAGSVVKLQTTLASLLGLNLATLWAVLILMVLGAALCFVFQPKTRQAGFALGLSVISIIMTATPTKPPGSPAGLPIGVSNRSGAADVYALLPSQAGVMADGPILRVQAPAGLLRLNFEINVKDDQPRPLGSITIRAREMPSGRIWQWTTDQFERQTTFPIRFFYEVPASNGISTIEVRVEAEHYNAATAQARVTPGVTQVKLSYSLDKSAVPNIIRKLFEQRQF